MKLTFSCIALAAVVPAFAANLYYVEDGSNTLRTVNTNTFVSSTIGGLGTGGQFGDLAFDNTTGTMFFVAGRGVNNLYTVNLSTGAATLVGGHGVNDMFTLGADGAGRLYGQSTAGNVYAIDKNTGAATLIGNNSDYPGGYTWDSANGRMIHVNAGGGNIYSVNLANGSSTLLATPGGINDSDIAFDAAGNQYFAMDWSGNLFHYTNAFGRTTISSGYGSVGSVEIAGVPEPATMAVLAGLGALALKRRRK